MAFTKAAVAGIGGIAGASALGVGINAVLSQKPNYTTFSTTGETSVDSGYAKDYKPYFVDHGRRDNDPWWNWAYKNRIKGIDIKNEKFKGVKNGSGTTNSLKKACEEAYTANDVVTTTSRDESKFNEEDVWKYCSVGGNKPKTIADTDHEREAYGKDNDVSKKYGNEHKDKLISVTEISNEWFWDLQEERFFGDEGTGKKANTVTSLFYKLHKKTKREENDTVRRTCEAAYKKVKNDSTSEAPEADVFRYCSLKGSEES